jgi:hypothetical protein
MSNALNLVESFSFAHRNSLGLFNNLFKSCFFLGWGVEGGVGDVSLRCGMSSCRGSSSIQNRFLLPASCALTLPLCCVLVRAVVSLRRPSCSCNETSLAVDETHSFCAINYEISCHRTYAP